MNGSFMRLSALSWSVADKPSPPYAGPPESRKVGGAVLAFTRELT
jgi:hypothetical protein